MVATWDVFSPFVGGFVDLFASIANRGPRAVYVAPHPEDSKAFAEYREKYGIGFRGGAHSYHPARHRQTVRADRVMSRPVAGGPIYAVAPDISTPLYAHVTGPQTLWNPEEVKEAERLGVHPSRLPTTPYAARYSNALSPDVGPGVNLPETIEDAIGQRYVGSSRHGFPSGLLDARAVFRSGQRVDMTTLSGQPWVIAKPEELPYGYVLADTTPAEGHPILQPGSPTVIPVPGGRGGSTVYTPSAWAESVGVSMEAFPVIQGGPVPSSIATGLKRELDATRAELARTQQALAAEQLGAEVHMANPSNISDAAAQWYRENRPGWEAATAPAAPDEWMTSAIQDPAPTNLDVEYVASEVGAVARPRLSSSPRPKNIVDDFIRAGARTREATVGWFDSLIDSIPEVLGGVGQVIGAVNQGPGTTYQSGAFPAPMTYSGGPPGQFGYPAPGATPGIQPALLGGMGDFLGLEGQQLPHFLPGTQAGEGFGEGGSPFYMTQGGRPRTRNLLEAVDWNGDRRYWVGGTKLSKKWIKSKILSDQRKRRCPR